MHCCCGSLCVYPCAQVFRILSMVLFIAYPTISVKIFRMFRCIPVEGKYWLVADMRLQCFTSRWVAFAAYGLAMAVVYVVGLPVLTVVILRRHRSTLFGPRSETTMKRFGFLYDRCVILNGCPSASLMSHESDHSRSVFFFVVGQRTMLW